VSEANVAKRYADALIEIAEEHGKIDAVGADLTRFSSLLDANDGQLNDFIASPVFTTEERENVLTDLLPKLDLDAFTVNLIKLMNANGRLAIFPHLRQAYNELADARNGRVRVQVTTAEALTPALESEIKSTLEQTTGQTVLIEHTIDPSLIGGMIARIGGKVYDSSLRTRLAQLKHSLITAEA
jgi:F-type H+-transporting ATPase subunit delta